MRGLFQFRFNCIAIAKTWMGIGALGWMACRSENQIT
jgi:hypothetical protein